MRSVKYPDNMGFHLSKEIEDQFSKTGDLYSRAIENVDGVPFQLIFGPQPGEGFYINVGENINKLLGIKPEEFTEKAYCEMIELIIPLSDDIPSDYSKTREKFLKGELKSFKAEVLIKTRTGEKKWIQDSSLPLLDELTGKVIGAFGILLNINENKQNLQRYEKAKQKAEESDRLKSSFLRNVSHEIRTPLNAIVGFTAFLSENEKDPVMRQEYLNIILSSTDHLLEIMNSIIEISEIEANTVKIRKDVVDICSTLRRAYTRFKGKAKEKNISLRLAKISENDELSLLTDSFKVLQVLTHLLDNAVKFTIEGAIEFGYSIKDRKIEFYVSDTGIGIPDHLHPKIFTRFFQIESSTTRRFEGSGLGLSISKAYVDFLGGDIWFESKPEGGTVFYFTIPYVQRSEQPCSDQDLVRFK
jgi:signal transduction histidine kinase